MRYTKNPGNYYWVLLYRMAIVMLLYGLCRFLFYILNISLFTGITMRQWLRIITGGLVFDVAALFYINALFIILMTAPLPLRWRVSGIYLTISKGAFYIFNGIALLLNCIDCIYYRFTLRRTTSSVLKEFAHEQNTSSLIKSFVVDYWYVALLFAAMLALMIWLYNRIKIKTGTISQSLVRYYLTASLVFFATVPLAIGGIRGDFRHSTRPITISDAGKYVDKPHEVYLVLNTPFTFIRTFGNEFLQKVDYFDEAELEAIYTPVHLPSDSVQKPFTKKNVVIIILESFGKEAVGFYNHELDGSTYKGFTPFLDSLASVSRVYWHSFANGRKSIDALPSIISGIPSAADPFVLTPYVTDSMQSMAHLLEKEGYYNSFFHGAPNGSMGFLSFMKMMGISNYFGKTEYDNDADYDGIWGIWDEPFLQFYANKLSSFPQPFFSSFFSVSSHHPFKVPKQYEGVFKKGPLPVLECIGYTDGALRKFFDKASKSEWFYNTLFVISADHATVTYHNEYQNAWGEQAIPILLYSPGDSSLQGIDSSTIQQTDIMPTVLGYLGYNKPFVAFGENVLQRVGDGFVFNYANGGYRWVQGDYMLFFDGKHSTALYNYTTDRMMRRNLLATEATRAASMERKLKAFIQQYNNRLIQNRLTANSGG